MKRVNCLLVTENGYDIDKKKKKKNDFHLKYEKCRNNKSEWKLIYSIVFLSNLQISKKRKKKSHNINDNNY